MMEKNADVDKLDEAFAEYREHSKQGFDRFMDQRAASNADNNVSTEPVAKEPRKRVQQKKTPPTARGRKAKEPELDISVRMTASY